MLSATDTIPPPKARERPNSAQIVVIADDDPDLREAIGLTLSQDGYTVVELEDGAQLLQYLTSHMLTDNEPSPILAVISDIRMPGRSGLDVLGGVRWAKRPPPFILMTAFTDAYTRTEAARLGAVALLIKPFPLDALRTAIRKLDGKGESS